MPIMDSMEVDSEEPPALSFDVFDAPPAIPNDNKGKAGRGKGKTKGKLPLRQSSDTSLERPPPDLDANMEPGSPKSTPASDKSKGKGKGKQTSKDGNGKGLSSELPKKQQDAFQKAKDLFGKTQQGFTDEIIWNSNMRRRSVDSATKALTNAEAALLPMVETYYPAEELSRAITAYIDDLEVRFGLLSSFRSTPFQFLTNDVMDDVTYNRLIAMHQTTLNSLITHVATTALKGLEQDWTVCSFVRNRINSKVVVQIILKIDLRLRIITTITIRV